MSFQYQVYLVCMSIVVIEVLTLYSNVDRFSVIILLNVLIRCQVTLSLMFRHLMECQHDSVKQEQHISIKLF